MPNKKWSKFVIISLLTLLAIGGEWYFFQVRKLSSANRPTNPLSQASNVPAIFRGLTNRFKPPPPETEVTKKPDWQKLQSDIGSITTQHDGTVGVFVKDLVTGDFAGYDTDRVFYAASLNKVPLIIGTLRAVDEGNLSLDQELIYLQKDNEEGSGTIILSPTGTSFSLEEVVTRAANQSDNAAKNMLFRYVPYSYINQVLITAKTTATNLQKNESTPQEVAAFFALVYQTDYLNPQSREIFFSILTNTVFEERLPQPLPQEIQVAHKIGSWPDTNSYHDCGIVFTTNPYVICVMTEDTSYDTAVEIIRQISLVTFEALK